MDELPNVLLSYRTTPRSTTGTSPFTMAYEVEVVSSIEVRLISPRIEFFNYDGSIKGFHSNLIEKIRDDVAVKTLLQQCKTTTYFNKKVKARNFLVDDLIFRESAFSQSTVIGKLKAPWEGLYKAIKVVGSGTYELAHLDGIPIKNTWNRVHLRKFYQ